jgi:hypothetical protein
MFFAILLIDLLFLKSDCFKYDECHCMNCDLYG